MEERSIRLEVAGRAYPLTVQADEEAVVRQVAAEINESIERLKENHPLTDKQDLLAMAALEVSARALHSARSQEVAAASAALAELEALLSPAPATS
jgi:cell division protein ZapA